MMTVRPGLAAARIWAGSPWPTPRRRRSRVTGRSLAQVVESEAQLRQVRVVLRVELKVCVEAQAVESVRGSIHLVVSGVIHPGELGDLLDELSNPDVVASWQQNAPCVPGCGERLGVDELVARGGQHDEGHAEKRGHEVSGAALRAHCTPVDRRVLHLDALTHELSKLGRLYLPPVDAGDEVDVRSEEHTSEL